MAINNVGNNNQENAIKENQSSQSGMEAVAKSYQQSKIPGTIKTGVTDINNVGPDGIKLTGEASKTQMSDIVNDANVKMQITNTRCEFEYHEKSHRVSIKVVDKDTDEIIKEIPPEESIKMVEKMWELAGLIFDEAR